MTDPPSTRKSFLSAVFLWTKGLILLALVSAPAFAQSLSLATLNNGPLNSGTANSIPSNSTPGNAGATTAAAVVGASLPEAVPEHKFWDGENRVLFVTVAGLSAADFALTRSILQNGGKELNPVTRLLSGSTAGLAVNFAGETAGVVGLSYLFHKTGHHKLERLTSLLDIGASSFAVVYDLNHR
ncbi:MAG: hypothetical protein WB711_01685 [Terriglobales bacterium]